ncbi:uncharacterized protein LOC132269496 isoform X2 [Cornus florida]|uniref:uncharacterized protein LOC132269496 isoform X2 n=1 Tax=Cornus florida TaxID=4283 RepID=UPI0028978A5C|nr:uncharacterized protein LOC132269496 isoform X2 [Cornus florida]
MLIIMQRNTFVQRVNQFLQLHSAPRIMSFRFSFCFVREFAGDVDRWISFAVRMGVEKLDLNFACRDSIIVGSMFSDNYNEMYNLSCQLLSEASKLNHLCLSSCTLQLEFGCFNNLISLDLNQVPLSCNELQMILSRCLKLEWLGVRRCPVPGKLCICGPSLKFLEVFCCAGLKEIELSAVNLTTFEFSEILETKFSFSNVPKLEQVFFRGYYYDAIDSIFSELTRDLPELKILSLSMFTLYVRYPKWPTSFSKVKQLELSINNDFEPDLLKITPILSACPLLQKFHIMMRSYTRRSEESTKEPPKCVHTQLKEVEFGGFSGTRNQIEFAIFLLKNAISLDKMIIDVHYKLYFGCGKWKNGCISTWTEDKRDEIHKQLQGRVISATAKVIIR